MGANAGILIIRTLEKKVHWNLKRNLYTFIQENAFETAVSEMAGILSRPQCGEGMKCLIVSLRFFLFLYFHGGDFWTHCYQAWVLSD